MQLDLGRWGYMHDADVRAAWYMHMRTYAYACVGEVLFLGVRHGRVYQAELPQRAMSMGLVTHTACLLFCVPSNVHMWFRPHALWPDSKSWIAARQTRGRRAASRTLIP